MPEFNEFSFIVIIKNNASFVIIQPSLKSNKKTIHDEIMLWNSSEN